MAAVTRKEQLARTRAALLDAAMMSLVEHGYAGTTTQRIQDRCGVSRGALLHHFGSKAELFVAAIHHIADIRLAAIQQVAEEVDGSDDALRRVVDAIVEAQSGPPFQAAMELWTAARTDPDLLAALQPAERKLGAALRGVFDRYSAFDSSEDSWVAFESLMAMLRGIEVTRVFRPDRSGARKIVDHWFESMLREHQGAV
ncbi:TetR family transcriptional regulator [Aeromicrobium sp. PE09-221]|uniref:TetR/AcrR family transcriptional regulator n=1 Tax=Aeromicrobium sp. PE09-221 TaxID=1898043 RepID=UPI000B3EBD4E|nr:TetR/AcrR family transcriptional regulator [Aeromicrobium sp. PE09-221]OUZ12407.1 TetR family transcriptional regulator [Aeromicrobium sp. PE09-221]